MAPLLSEVWEDVQAEVREEPESLVAPLLPEVWEDVQAEVYVEPEAMEFMLAPRLPEASEHESVQLEPEAL